MIGKKTIVIEDRLREIFEYLPDVAGTNSNNFKPVFKVGDENELLAFFAESTQETNYPLIWLQMPYDENHINRKRVMVEPLTLILAVETNNTMRNSERLNTTFKPILMVLLDNILDAFTKANTIDFDLNYGITKYGNYSNEDDTKGKFVDIWDAIKVTVTISVNSNCLREIKF
jgi:hypothetical protein